MAIRLRDVHRYVRKLIGEKTPEAPAIIVIPLGEEAQVDYEILAGLPR